MDNTQKIVLTLLLAVLCAGCKTHQIAVTPVPEPHYNPDTTVLPAFPAEVLYVLGSEWEAIYDCTSAKYHTPEAQQLRADSVTMGDYLEQRLLTLYPERAYPGYINKVTQQAQALLMQAPSRPPILNYMHEELHFTSTTPAQNHNAPTLFDTIVTDEAALLEFTPREQALWDTLQTLANQAGWADRPLFDTLHISSVEEENLLISLLLWKGPRLFYRIVQSKTRAENVARYYYGDATNSGRPGDAFKHIYVNVLLRTYTDALVAWAVMDLFWESYHVNAPADHFMDAHNNIVGRETQYWRFVNPDSVSQCSDVRQWLLWAEQVQHFVQDTTNGDLQHWDKQTPSFIVVPQAEQVSKMHYLYWDR